MGLQVWLPLNGNLNNQGLSNYQVTNTNAIINTNGKIGDCYQFGTAQSYLELPKECMRNLSTECTVSFWIKFITRNSSYETYFQAGLGGYAWNDYVFGLLRNSNGNSCCFTISNGSSASNASYTTPNLTELNTWYHITLVYKTGHCLVYINGELYQDYTTTIIPAFDKITTITIGCSNNKFSYQTNCLINDFRIYDEALSPREIKEISKGLVLHYPLNREGFGADNLLKAPNHQIYHDSNNHTTYPVYRSFLTENGIEYEHIVRTSQELNPTAFSIYGLVSKNVIDTSVTAGQTITVSAWVRCSHDQSGTYLQLAQIDTNVTSAATNGTVTPIRANEWTKLTLTTTIAYSYADIRASTRAWDISVYGISIPSGEISNFYFDFRQDYKVEIGENSTPWVPNQSDSLYSAMALDENLIHDTSGFQNNGELVVIGKNLIDKNNVTSGGYINSAGSITPDSGWNYTNYIKVKPSTSYIASSISSGGSGTYFALYDENKTLTRTVLITANQNPTFTTIAAERYVRFSIRSLSNELDTAKLERGTTVTAYGSEGSIEWETNSPRYTLACNPHSANSTQDARPGTTYIRGDCALTTPNQLTIAFWCYTRSGYGGQTGQGAFCTSMYPINSDGIGGDYQTTAMNHRDNRIDVNSSDGNSHIRPTITFIANEWHHYAFTYDGQNARTYRDGVLQDTKSFSAATALGTFNMVVLGLSRAGGVWRRNDNTYSDLRVYATALSVDDIIELYHTPVTLSNNGTLMTQGEYMEV